MAEEEKPEVQEKEVKKVSKKKLVIFLIIGILIIILAASAVFLIGSKKEGGEAKETHKSKETVLYQMEPIVVNLFDPTGKRYLQLRLSLELENKKLEEEIKSREPQIMDVIISTLSSKTPEEVLQPEAKEMIKQELLSKINSSFGKDVVLNIYITQYIVE